MTKQELIKLVADQSNETQTTVKTVIESFTSVLKDTVNKGEVFAFNEIGTFRLIQRKERICRNPKDGSKVKVPAKKVVKFKVAKTFKDSVN